jgi:hypothetical protein
MATQRGPWVGPKGHWHNVSDGTDGTPGLKHRFDPNGDIQTAAEVDPRPHQTWRFTVIRGRHVGVSNIGKWAQAWDLIAEATAQLP